jgi:hypothetical protein
MVTLANQQRVLKNVFKDEVLHYFGGGQFTVTRELIVFVNMLVSQGDAEAVLIDDKEVPIRVTDLKEFQANILETYKEAVTNYYTEYDKLRKNRSVEKLVEYE